MSTRVRLKNRRRDDPAAVQGGLEEIVILRDEEVVAVLPEGDPLRHALGISLDALRSLRADLAPVLEGQPRAKQVLEAVIEYKEQQTEQRRS